MRQIHCPPRAQQIGRLWIPFRSWPTSLDGQLVDAVIHLQVFLEELDYLVYPVLVGVHNKIQLCQRWRLAEKAEDLTDGFFACAKKRAYMRDLCVLEKPWLHGTGLKKALSRRK